MGIGEPCFAQKSPVITATQAWGVSCIGHQSQLSHNGNRCNHLSEIRKNRKGIDLADCFIAIAYRCLAPIHIISNSKTCKSTVSVVFSKNKLKLVTIEWLSTRSLYTKHSPGLHYGIIGPASLCL